MSSASRDNELKSPSRTSINVKIPSLQSDTVQGKARSQGTFTPESRISLPASVDFPGSECGTQGHRFSKNRSSPTESQSQSLRHGVFNEKELIQQTAALMIEKAWIRYRDRQMFRLLKHSVCAAENSLSYEILRKVSPREAELLGDKSQQVRVRFRFGGREFPPMIFFKIFINNMSQKVKYISGRKMIKPATEAAEDSLRQMGNRIFYDQMLQDTIRQQQCSVSDEVDITTLKDYMQYLSTLDESPAYQGGKENYWRKLTLDDLPRHTIFFDVVDFAYNTRVTPRLKQEIPLLASRPVTQEVQVRHIKAISKLRTPVFPFAPMPTPSKSKMSGVMSQMSSRRSRQARLRALKMRKLYSRETGDGMPEKDLISDEEIDEYFNKLGLAEGGGEIVDDYNEGNEEEEDWDREATQLYQWTQDLSFHDDIMETPMMTT